MNKVIVIVGVLDTKESTNVSMAKAFINFGFQVLPINYRIIIKEYGMKFFEEYLIKILKKHQPYLTIFCKTNGINPSIIFECNKYSKTYHWFMDPVITVKSCPEVIQIAKACNFSSCTAGGTCDYFREFGVSNCINIFDGLDTDLYKPTNVDSRYSSEVGFIGSKNPNRDSLYKILVEKEIDVKFYGPGYTDYINYDVFRKICSSTKFMLSINNEQLTDYFSNRLLRMMGCGACILHYDPTGTLEKYFKHNEEILYFKNQIHEIDELINLIKTTTLEKAGKIALNAREKVLNNYTWINTAIQMLKVVQNG